MTGERELALGKPSPAQKHPRAEPPATKPRHSCALSIACLGKVKRVKDAAAGTRPTGTPRPSGKVRSALAAVVERFLLVFLVLVELLRQVVLNAHFADGVQLALQKVDVLFLVNKDLL